MRVRDYDKDEEVLRQFDLDMADGLCSGMIRMVRWEHASRLGLNPFKEVEQLLNSPNLSTHRPNSNNWVKCPISKVNKGPNRVRDKPEDRTDHSVTASDEQVDGRSGTGTEGGLALLEPENRRQYIANQSRRHWTDNCWNLRHVIQDSIDTKQFVLPPASATTAQPNINNNPLPAHPAQPLTGSKVTLLTPLNILRPSTDSRQLHWRSQPRIFSQSTKALSHYRALNANIEAQLFLRIKNLKNQISYGQPPQLNNGEYAQLRSVGQGIIRYQNNGTQSRLQEQLFDKMLAQPTIDSIREISPYRNIRETAFDFSKQKDQIHKKKREFLIPTASKTDLPALKKTLELEERSHSNEYERSERRPLRNEQFFSLILVETQEEVSNRGRSECSRHLKDYMELKSFILSSQFRNRLCRDCNYCFRVLSPASRPCVGGVKLGDFSFVGNQLSRNLHSAPFNNEISKDDFFFLHCFLTHSKDDTWYIIHAFPSKISRCIGTLRTLEYLPYGARLRCSLTHFLSWIQRDSGTLHSHTFPLKPLWGMKNRREEESGSLERSSNSFRSDIDGLGLTWFTRYWFPEELISPLANPFLTLPLDSCYGEQRTKYNRFLHLSGFSLLLVPVPNSSPGQHLIWKSKPEKRSVEIIYFHPNLIY
ncbi:hypothetical protein F8388_016250 [Cannabis sativa]|uniref:Uncharacterized protein n=1 Tax=Cannabis sativa TaxID=3483 RepID=A0A7J6GEA0_CANSA|nr:hypothetical protein F8388_016250 [Cannabis sativa]